MKYPYGYKIPPLQIKVSFRGQYGDLMYRYKEVV
jgi:hypothetical protein